MYRHILIYFNCMICSFEYCKEHCIFPDYRLTFFLNKAKDSLLLDSRVLVELHLDVILEVLLVVRFEYLIKLVDKYQRKIH